MDQSNFDRLVLPVYAKSSCSPQFDEGFKGMLIAMPHTVQLTEDSQIPLCGLYRVDSTFANQVRGDMIEQTVVVFKNVNTLETFSFNLVPDKDPISASPVADPSSVDGGFLPLENAVKLQYFNVDVLTFYPNFPETNADYLVYATQQTIRSNTLKVSVIN